MNKATKTLDRLLLSLAFLLVPMLTLAQSTISGKVVDETNEPIIGATVTEGNNTKNGVVTDLDGNFKIKISQSGGVN